MIWVVDTSAIVRLFVPDGPLHPEIEAALNRAMHGADVVLAPDLMLAESANTHNLTVYDALYLALAERHGARLMTCDDRLDRVAKTMGLGAP
jgi:predicted nucleic acid-binding protein